MDILYTDEYRKLNPSNSQHRDRDCALEGYIVNVLTLWPWKWTFK